MGGKANEEVNKEKASNQLDNLNLLYVAFTRAVQRLYVIAKQGKADKPNVIRGFLADKGGHQVSGSEALVYRFGSPDFRNPEEEAEEDTVEMPTDSISMDWFEKINVDPEPTKLWQVESERLQPREWGEKVHAILSQVRYPKDLETVLKPNVADGTLDQAAADWIRDRFNQMASHPMIQAAFGPDAKVKTECEVLYQCAIRRFDRYAELDNAIYLIDYKTGKTNEKYNEQVQLYSKALKEMTDKEIRGFLVYLSDGIILEQVC